MHIHLNAHKIYNKHCYVQLGDDIYALIRVIFYLQYVY